MCNDHHPSLSISGMLGLRCLCPSDAHSFCQLDCTRNSQDWAVHTFERLTQKKALQHSELITPTQETRQHRAYLRPWSSGYRVGSEDIFYRWSRSECGDMLRRRASVIAAAQDPRPFPLGKGMQLLHWETVSLEYLVHLVKLLIKGSHIPGQGAGQLDSC